MEEKLIETYVRLLIEREVKQAHLPGHKTTAWGSDDHITSLEARLADMAYWRDKNPKGSEKRSHYRNIYSALKKELQSARKHSQRLNEKQRGEE
jgi:hypothetical protein